MTTLPCECKWETRTVTHMTGSYDERFRLFTCIGCELKSARVAAEQAAQAVKRLEQQVAEKERMRTPLGRAELQFEQAQAKFDLARVELERVRRGENK